MFSELRWAPGTMYQCGSTSPMGVGSFEGESRVLKVPLNPNQPTVSCDWQLTEDVITCFTESFQQFVFKTDISVLIFAAKL